MSDEQNGPSEEFEREPVPERARLGFKSFLGMYAGEHCAGTELMIGPLFVIHGVSAFDLIVGLFVGNLLATLSWRYLTTPIATQSRLTLYYHLEKICGRNLVTIYNLANGVMFCFLAGAMITVSATAVGVGIEQWSGLREALNFSMPGLTDFYPDFSNIGWILSVLVVGALISIVAAYGYDAVSKFANIAAPWMVLVFLAFGVVALRQFMETTDTEIHSAGDLWTLASEHIWKGGEPFPGLPKFTIWHVLFFAWFCNMAMHIGMSDLSIFRFARKNWYGIAPASGMYVGHFMAWIAAAMLFALFLHQSRPDPYMAAVLVEQGPAGKYTTSGLAQTPLSSELISEAMLVEKSADPAELASLKQRLIDDGAIGPTDDLGAIAVSAPGPLPGPLAYQACGLAGLLCVIIAGWTTANPTIYRAGLAFQAIMPSVSRFKVTLATGLVATLAGLFPGLAMKLLGFVALYGMLLMPMGAVIFVDFYLLPKLGLKSNYAHASGLPFNLAAGLTWLVTLGICLVLVQVVEIQIWFVSLPGWFVAAGLYIVLSKLLQRKVAV
jgi:purine-cytosine permease-like protein